MPTDPMITYFQDASSDGRVRRCPTRNTVAIVVPSIATQLIAALPASNASSIVATNMGTSDPNRRAPPSGGMTVGQFRC